MFTKNTLIEKNYFKQNIVKIVLGLMTFALVIPTFLILGTLLVKGAPAISWSFIFSNPERGMTAGGIFPALVGTIWLVVISLILTCPVGVVAAIYLSEYAPDNKLTRSINLAILNLAGVPSIVHALFGLGAFVLFFKFGTSILAASCTLAIMNLPIVIASTKEALQSVPQSYRQASLNCGASQWQTIRYIVLPNSISGILTGVIFSVARAAGETAPIIFTGAAFYLPFLPNNVFDQCMALAMHLFTISTQVVGVPESFPYATALVLIAVVFSVNAFSIGLRYYFRKNRKW
ncbi:MAG: phosphate ABC transporter permease PstA [Bacteriovoracaceae bacterium]